MSKEKDKYFLTRPICPRCGVRETRDMKKKELIRCRTCGYQAHWRQFFLGQREREEVQKLFKKGIIEGKEYIDWGKLEEKDKKKIG